MKCLFIGGSQDGNRLEIDERMNQVRFPKSRGIPAFPGQKEMVEIETYLKQRWRFAKGNSLQDAEVEECIAYVSEDVINPVSLLLRGYHAGESTPAKIDYVLGAHTGNPMLAVIPREDLRKAIREFQYAHGRDPVVSVLVERA